MDSVLIFDEEAKLYILAMLGCEVTKARYVIESDSKDAITDNFDEQLTLDKFIGIYKRDGKLGFVSADLYGLVQLIEDLVEE